MWIDIGKEDQDSNTVRKVNISKTNRYRQPNPTERTSSMCNIRNEASLVIFRLGFRIQISNGKFRKVICGKLHDRHFDDLAGEYPRGALVHHE